MNNQSPEYRRDNHNQPPNDEQSKGDMIGSFLLGMAATLLIGGGICVAMLSDIGGGGSYEEEDIEAQSLSVLQQNQQQALKADSPATDKWLYAHVLKNAELREALGLDLSKEQALAQAKALTEQAVAANEVNAIYERGFELITQSFVLPDTDTDTVDNSYKYRTDTINDLHKMDTGIQLIAQAVEQQCDFLVIDTTDKYDIINAIESGDGRQSQVSYYLSSIMANPALQDAQMRYKIMALYIYDEAKCDGSVYQDQLFQRQALAQTEVYSLEHRAFDYVLAQALRLESLQKSIRININEADLPQFEQITQAITEQYIVLFDTTPQQTPLREIDSNDSHWASNSLLF